MDKQNDAKHTPGPWWPEMEYHTSVVSEAENSCTRIVAAPRSASRLITIIGDAGFSPANPECFVSDKAEAEANARLMAAAPELLVALQEAMEVVKVFHGLDAWEIYRDKSPEMIRWRTLIAKVRDPAPKGPPEACPHCGTPVMAGSDHLSDAHGAEAETDREEGRT
ncbi:MAG TPA: hypothetical protein VHQ92_13485 [Pseudolabrys sp.]|jgi:hypothetical protein|nr:hypothetical protein [Pseudolabrys sp.]